MALTETQLSNLLLTDEDINSISSSKLKFTTSETNGVTTTIQENLERQFVFEDFGAKGDWDDTTQTGTDDTTAITNCLAQAKASGTFAYGSPGKKYKITSTLALNNNKIDGRNSSFVKAHSGVGIKVTGGAAFTDLQNLTLECSTANTSTDFDLDDGGAEVNNGSLVRGETYIIYTTATTPSNFTSARTVESPTQSGTFSQSGNTITVTKTDHGLETNDKAFFNFAKCDSSKDVTDQSVTKTDNNVFTYTAADSETTSGSVDFGKITNYLGPDAAKNLKGEIFTATAVGNSGENTGTVKAISNFKHGIWVEGTRVRAHNVIVSGHKGCGIYIRANVSSHNCNRSRYTDIVCNGNSIAGLFLDGYCDAENLVPTAAPHVEDDMAVIMIRGQFNSNKGYGIYASQLCPIRASDIYIQQAEGNFTGAKLSDASSGLSHFRNDGSADCKHAVTFDKARNCTIGGYVEQKRGLELKLGDNTSMCNVHSQRENQDTDTGTAADNVWRSGNRLHTPGQDTIITSKGKKLTITTAALGINETAPDLDLHVTSDAKEVAKFESTHISNNTCEIVFESSGKTLTDAAVPADNDEIASFLFNGVHANDEAGSTVRGIGNYCQLKAKAADVTTGQVDGAFEARVKVNNSMTTIAQIVGTGIMPGSDNALNFGSASLRWDTMHAVNLKLTGNGIDFTALPTSNPNIAGRLYRDGNDVKISTG